MKKRFIAAAMAAMVSAFAFAACSGGSDSASTASADGAEASGAATTATGEEIKIGGLAPLTGDVSVYGIAASNGAKLAVAEANANGMNISFECLDEKGDPNEATNAYDKLVASGVVGIVGDVTSKPSIAVAQVAAQDNMPMISGTATADEVTSAGPNVFRACFTDPFQGEVMAKYAAEKLSLKKAAILYNNADDYSEGLMKSFESTAATVGLEIVAKESYTGGDVDFKSQLTKIKSAGADCLFGPVYYQDVAQIAAQAKEVGVDVQLLGADGWEGVIKQLGGNGTETVDGAYFCCQFSSSSEDEKVVNFVNAYKEAYDEEPSQFAALGYDAMMIMIESIEAAGSTDSQAIIDAMQAIEYTGLTGTITFDENGTPDKAATITTIENGEYKVVEAYK